MPHPLARWSSLTPSKRLRVAGVLLLIVGVAGASLFYWLATRSPAPTMDELMPGYSRARSRQIGIMMGDLGVTLMAWLDALEQPGTQAVLIAAVSALGALICFRVAGLLDRSASGRPAPHLPDAHRE